MPFDLDPLPVADDAVTRRASRWSVVVAPTGRPVEWAELKAHLRLDADTQQAYVERLIDAATAYAEERLATSLMPRTLLATFYDGEQLVLPRGPLIEIQSIVDANDVAATDYQIAHAGHRARVTVTSPGLTYPISVQYRAGYASASAIPADICVAIMTHVGTLFERRESVIAGAIIATVPHSLDAFYTLRSRSVCVG